MKIFFLIAPVIVLIASCNIFTEPEENQKLVIENGFYSKVETADPDEIKYAIEFSYFVRGEKCNWGGYSIQMDSYSGCLDLYKMQTMESEKRYQRADTFKVSAILITNPIIKMQGYPVGSSELYNELYAEYILQPE